ncbi:class I SAM-dependent methyltransferase [Oligoflexia bacterium]|nr:class I SAM-dependent methyltransferase [Oligoflexia bacterium]
MASTYNQLHFESRPSPERHIGRLAVMARLFGMEPAPVNNCRVLEIGCSTGSNIIPQALAYPKSSFLGIDIAERQISVGQEQIKALAIDNIELQAADIAKVKTRHKQFDYIICHGVFSWVASKVQEKILAFCRETLTPNGLVYLSYNCLPGWNVRGVIRASLVQADNLKLNSAERVQQARAAMALMQEQLVDEATMYGLQLREELASCGLQSDAFVLHELLEEHCYPFYIKDLADKVGDYKLQYVCESHPSRMRFSRFAELLASKPVVNAAAMTRVDREQYLDILFPLSFRGSIFCRKQIELREEICLEHLPPLCIASTLVPLKDRPEVHSDDIEVFCGPGDITVEVSDPLQKAALLYLRTTWPEATPFAELLKGAWQMVSADTIDADREAQLAEGLFGYFLLNLVELHVGPLHCSSIVEHQPLASPFAHLQARDREWVTNLRHEYFRLGALERRILLLLDGDNDRDAIVEEVLAMIAKGDFTPGENGQPVTDPDRQKELAVKQIDCSLELFSERALLIDSEFGELYSHHTLIFPKTGR